MVGDIFERMRVMTLARAAKIDARYGEEKRNGTLYKRPPEPWTWTRNEGSPESVARRRNLLAQLPKSITPEQLTEINARFHNSCALSEVQTDIHADHAIPVSIGHGGTEYGNMIPLNGRLNSSKHNAHLYEWFDANHERLGLSQTKFDTLITHLADVNEMTPTEYRKYTDWCFDNPREICEETGGLVFIGGEINERTRK